VSMGGVGVRDKLCRPCQLIDTAHSGCAMTPLSCRGRNVETDVIGGQRRKRGEAEARAWGFVEGYAQTDLADGCRARWGLQRLQCFAAYRRTA
jgi:hypothetical protein